MRTSDLRELPETDFVKEVAQSKEELFNLRFQHATGELENTARLRQARQNYARVLTVAKERDIQV